MKEKIKIQIKSIFGKLLFEWESEDNTIKEAVEKAIKENADLRSADLSYADLSSANLSSADLSYADLSSANLSYADLSSANLSYADLRSANLSYADLRSADLSYANLRSANLSYANLRSANLRSANLSYANLRSADLSYADLSYAVNKELAYIPMFCKWNVSLLGEKIKIGCKEKSIEEWDIFFSGTDEFETKRGTEQFKQIEAMYLGYRAYLLHLQK